MMRSDAGLHPDQARRHIRKTSLYLATRPLLTQHDRTGSSRPTTWNEFFPISTPTTAIAFCAAVPDIACSLSGRPLAGQEHGRTIPLAEVAPVGSNKDASFSYGFV
jgi:hypothetical protein